MIHDFEQVYMERNPQFDHHHDNYDQDEQMHDQQRLCEDDDDHDHDHDNFSFSTTGYLEDVLFEFTSKRRRLNHTSIRNCWTSNLIHNFNTTLTSQCDSISESKEAALISETYNNDQNSSSSLSLSLSSSISTSPHKEESPHNYDQWTVPHHKGNLYCTTLDTIFPSGARRDIKKKRMVAKVVYPFALVKPGGFEGDATLNDINQRILMPPTRPVRHPVGDFACRPLVSPDGPGLSGKAVVAFTRIQTQGRGTITIIRTRD